MEQSEYAGIVENYLDTVYRGGAELLRQCAGCRGCGAEYLFEAVSESACVSE